MADPVLPKGIVLNTSWIYDEIAKETVVTPEAIKKYWRGIPPHLPGDSFLGTPALCLSSPETFF